MLMPCARARAQYSPYGSHALSSATWHSSSGEMVCDKVLPAFLLNCNPHALHSKNRQGVGKRLHFVVFVVPQCAHTRGSVLWLLNIY